MAVLLERQRELVFEILRQEATAAQQVIEGGSERGACTVITPSPKGDGFSGDPGQRRGYRLTARSEPEDVPDVGACTGAIPPTSAPVGGRYST